MARYVVASVDELPPGTRKIVDVAGRQIVDAGDDVAGHQKR